MSPCTLRTTEEVMDRSGISMDYRSVNGVMEATAGTSISEGCCRAHKKCHRLRKLQNQYHERALLRPIFRSSTTE